MISIKRFLEQHRNKDARPDDDILQASLQMGRLLLDAVAIHMIPGSAPDQDAFSKTMSGLGHKMSKPPSAIGLLELLSEAVEAMETYGERTAGYLRKRNEQMQSMVVMLTQTLADASGQSEASVGRFQGIEREIEHASGLDDILTLRSSLENCLGAVREAAVQQRKSSGSTLERLRDQIDATQHRIDQDHSQVRPSPSTGNAEIDLVPQAPDDVPEVVATSYVAVFKLQRADHIGVRFGEVAKHQMLAAVSTSLKGVLGANDRLLRWKGTSFVMFLNCTATINEAKVLLSEAVARTGQHYIEAGKKSALLSVGIDWIVFPQAQCKSLDAVFSEVDSFLATEKLANTRYVGHALASRKA